MKKTKLAALLLAVMCIGGCSGNNTAVDVGKSSITKSDFEYYLESVKESMAGTELTSEEDWNNNEIEGKKAIDVAKERAYDTAVKNALYIEIGKAKTPLTSDEQKTIDDFEKNMTTRMGGEDKYKEFLEQSGMTGDFFKMLFESETYRRKLADIAAEEEPATDEEIKEEFLKEYRRAKHILILTTDSVTKQPLSSEEQENAKKLADEVYKKVQNGGDFDALMNEYSQDPGLATNPDGYVFTDNEMVAEFQDGVDSLENGGVCMVESSYGYHIIKRLAIDETDELYSKFLANAESDVEELLYNEKLNAKLDGWQKECNIKVTLNEDYYKDLK